MLFVSSAPQDAEQVSHLTGELAARGFSFWSDQNGQCPDPPHGDDVLHRAIRASSALLLVASPGTRSARSVQAALGIAQMYERPAYAVLIDAETWMEALPAGWGTRAEIDARGERYPDAVQTLVKQLRRLQDASSARPETPAPLVDLSAHPRNPYKGLRSFEREDAGDFFGRDQCIDALAHALAEALLAAQPAPRFLAVIGPRGSGKSSAVMAGLLPQLQQGRLMQSHEWIYLKRMVPGQHPLQSLAFTLSEHFPGRSTSSIREELEDMRGLHRLAETMVERTDSMQLVGSPGFRRLAATPLGQRDTDELVESPFFGGSATAVAERKDTQVLLFVDQFEELFTHTRSEEERRHFLDLLVTAMTEPEGPVMVLLALRADFYDRPLRYRALGQLIEAHHRAILPMTVQELRAAIEKPAHLPDVHLHFEDNLVGDLIFDAQGQGEALPLLQFTLAQLFERRDDGQLTQRAYQQIGGVGGALAKHAESTYLSLPSQEHRRWAQALFLRLIDAGSVDRDATCRRIPISELTLIDPGATAVLHMVWNTFTEKGLLATSTVMGTPTIEVSHAALIGAWGRLTKWVQEAQEDSSVQARMSRDVTEWIRDGKPADRLYTGEQLAEAQRWRTRTIPSRDEDAFLRASSGQHQRERHRTTRRAVVVGIAALGLTGGALSLSRLLHWGEATPVQTRPPLQTLPYTYSGHRGAVLSVAWSPDGSRIASASADRTVQVWEAQSGRLLLSYGGHTSFVISVAWSPDGSRIASAGDDRTVQVWEAASGSRLLSYTRHGGTVESALWSPDGSRIASASVDRTVQVWEAQSGRPLLTYSGHGGTVNTAVWSPDGSRIASASTRTAQVWESASGRQLLIYRGHRGFVVYCVAWSPDGSRIASASFDQTVQVWAAPTR